MSHKYRLVAAAVTVALYSGYADASVPVPTLAQAAVPDVSFVMAGSSAAQSALFSEFETVLCGGASNALVVNSVGDSPNFFALSCYLSISIGGTPGIGANSLLTIYYRTEGESIVGAVPIVSGNKIKRLNLADTNNCTASGNTGTCKVVGTTSTSGTVDSWSGAVTEDVVNMGVTDVEPAQLTGLDYPSNYSASVFGSATPAQLAKLPTIRLFQQVFGLAVNTSSGSGLPTSTGSPGVSTINLSKAAAANILSGNYTDWSLVPNASGEGIASAHSPITLIDRELGTGTRVAANIYFLNYACGSDVAIPNQRGEQLYPSTADQLVQANATPGAITYTTIDQILNPANGTKWPNLALVQINGGQPNTLNAAAGFYDFWFEATLVPNPVIGTNTPLGNLITFIRIVIPRLDEIAQLPDLNAAPLVGDIAAVVPLVSNGQFGTKAVYLNPYTRAGNSCNVPGETNQ